MEERCESINDSGAVAGYAVDSVGAYLAMARAASRNITAFTAPGGPYPVTAGNSINHSGDIAGYVLNSSHVSLGFIRTP